MNLLYLEFIGAIEIDRAPVAVNPAISFDKPIGKTSVKQFTYMDTRKQYRNIEELEKQLENAKKEQENAIKYLYKKIKELADKNNSQLSNQYIKHELEDCKMPRAIVRSGILWDGQGSAEGDVIFLEDEIVLFMNWCTLDFLKELEKRFSSDIHISKPVFSRLATLEIHIDMEWCLK